MDQYSDLNMKCMENTCFKEDLKDNTFYIMIIPKTILMFLFENFLYITLFFTLYFVLKIIYRSYWNPYYLKKDLSEMGFGHIPAGIERDKAVSRAQTCRNYGTNIPPPYPNGWFEIADSSAVKTGAILSVHALGQDLCVYRGEDKIARCVDAYCPHLGANLGVGGSVRGNCIECPFHKWRFSGDDGACVHVPGLEQAPKGVFLKHCITKEVDGAVCIWHDAEHREPLWDITSAPELESWDYRGRYEFTIRAHIQEVPENGADIDHLHIIHSTSMLTKIGEKYPFLHNLVGYHVWSGSWIEGDGHMSTISLTHAYKILKYKIGHTDIQVSQIGPGQVRMTLHSLVGPMLVCQSVTPLSANVQRVIHRVFSPAYNAPVASMLVILQGIMFERDVVVWNNKRFRSSPTYVRTDKTIRLYRSWFSQFYSENSISFRDAMQNNLEW